MSSSSILVGRELYGILGNIPDSGAVRSMWDAYFKANAMDACLTKYPTTVDTLPERLSEMFHFDRRAYLVGQDLQEAIVLLLDNCDVTTPNVVVNIHGVFTGVRIQDQFSVENIIRLTNAMCKKGY